MPPQCVSVPPPNSCDTPDPMLHIIKASHRVAKYSLLPLALLYGISRHQISKLPAPAELLRDIRSAPIQEATDESEFTFTYRKTNYLVHPRATYTLRGLIVSHNNIEAFDDIYHDADSVDLKDICVIWGGNVMSGVYQQLKFWSEPWSCHYRYDNEIGAAFDPAALSNNHLIAEDPAVQEIIRSFRLGDQVELTGMLVDYRPALYPDHLRKTSLIRTDTGNGACEVFFVDEARVLQPANRLWHSLHHFARIFGLITAAVFLATTILIPYLELRRTIRETNR